MNRCSIGIELQEDYIKVGLRRVGIQSTHNGEFLHPSQKEFPIREFRL